MAALPATRFRLGGAAERLKSGGAATTSVAAVLWTVAPLVAVITVSCADPLPPAMAGGLKLQFAWLSGSPLSVSDTSPVNPFTGETETAYETAPPAAVLAEDGATPGVKSGVVASHW